MNRPAGRSLISAQNSWLQNLVGTLAAIVIMPVGLVFAIVLSPFAKPIELTAKEVAKYLRDFIDGTGDVWDWDDFESNPIADPRLDSIRKRASKVALPVTDVGMIELRALLAETENLIEQST